LIIIRIAFSKKELIFTRVKEGSFFAPKYLQDFNYIIILTRRPQIKDEPIICMRQSQQQKNHDSLIIPFVTISVNDNFQIYWIQRENNSKNHRYCSRLKDFSRFKSEPTVKLFECVQLRQNNCKNGFNLLIEKYFDFWAKMFSTQKSQKFYCQ